MKLVTPFLKRVVYPSLSIAGLLPRFAGAGLAVVTYHGVLPQGYEPVDAALDGNLITAEALRRQLRLLKSRYRVISPDEALAWAEGRSELPPRAVLLTCDDGLFNCLSDMLPVLLDGAVKCLFFVTGESAGASRATLWYEDLFLLFLHARNGVFEVASHGVVIRGELGSREERRAVWWSAVKQLSQVSYEARKSFLREARSQLGPEAPRDLDRPESVLCRRYGLMTVEELRKLASAGMTIGAHTLSHPMLSQAPAELAREEIAGSKSCLESAMREEVWAFAYPFGDPQSVTPQVLAMAEEAGFSAGFVNFGGGLGVELSKYSLPRLHVTAGMSEAEFEAHVSGFYSRLRGGIGRRG